MKGATIMATKRAVRKNTKASEIYLDEAFDNYIAEKIARNLADATITSYQESYQRFKVFIGVDCRVDSVCITTIHKWIAAMKADGLKHVSINHYLRAVRTLLYWCMDKDRAYIPQYKIELLKGQEETLKTFDDDEVLALIERPHRKADFTEWRTFAIVNWVLATGNRASTIVSVKMCDVDLQAGYITLAHTKNKKAQRVPLSSALNTVIKEYIRMWRKNAKDDDYLFCNIGNEHLTTNALRISFRRYCMDRGVSKTSIHGLRHTFAKGWIKNRGNTFELQRVLGHSTLDMTRKYVALFDEDIKTDYDRFSPLDNLKKGRSRTRTVERTA
jgi:integrase/recombinase XerD